MGKILVILLFGILLIAPIWAANESCNTTASGTGGEVCLGPPQAAAPAPQPKEEYYAVVPISATVIAAYLATYVLVKRNIMSLANQRKFWNLMLVLAFLGLMITVLIILFKITSGPIVLPNYPALRWHGGFGIATLVIGSIHALWHLPYFKAYFAKV